MHVFQRTFVTRSICFIMFVVFRVLFTFAFAGTFHLGMVAFAAVYARVERFELVDLILRTSQ